MAKAAFHKGQKVFVKPVGTWAVIERVLPQWVKGVDEPLRVFYDVSLGRDFSQSELAAEAQDDRTTEYEFEQWRLVRAKNKFQGETDTTRHPIPGTFPVVCTDENDWGGWRVPGSEYDRDPEKIEFQARIIANGMKMLKICKHLAQFTAEHPHDVPKELVDLAKTSMGVLRYVYEVPNPTGTGAGQATGLNMGAPPSTNGGGSRSAA